MYYKETYIDNEQKEGGGRWLQKITRSVDRQGLKFESFFKTVFLNIKVTTRSFLRTCTQWII